MRAQIETERGQLAEAARLLDLARAGDPNDGYLVAQHALALWAAGRRDEALGVARDAVARFPDQAEAWLVLGRMLEAGGDASGAARALAHAVAVAPDDPDVRLEIATAAGASLDEQSAAVESAASARDGDRTRAWRTLVLGSPDARAILPRLRRAEARRAFGRHQWSRVETLLAPLVTAGASRTTDRVLLINARLGDGRERDAARLIPGLPVLPASDGISLEERAELWLRAGRTELAVEDAERAAQTDSTSIRARTVLAESLLASGQIERALLLVGQLRNGGSVPASLCIAAARSLTLRGRPELAERVLRLGLAANGRTDPLEGDRLRIELSVRLGDRSDGSRARALLDEVESAWGRHARAERLVGIVPPSQTADDLRARTNDPFADAMAAASLALLCSHDATVCTPEERDLLVARARRDAPESPATLRALAATTENRSVAVEYARQALDRDPASRWNALLGERTALRATTGRAPRQLPLRPHRLP